MAKRATQEKELTKKQIALSRRQRQQQKRVLIGVGVVVTLVLGVVLMALYDQFVAKPSRPVAIVNGVQIRADQYQSRDRYERFVLDSQLRYWQTQLDSMDPNDPTYQFLFEYYYQPVYQQRMGVDQQVVDDMVVEEIVRQKAVELGLTVSEDDLNEAVRANIANQSGFLTESQATIIASTAVAATATAETFTPTPQPTATPTLRAEPQGEALTATAVTTGTPTPSLQEMPTPAPTPTSHIITDAEFDQAYTNYLKVLRDQPEISEDQYRALTQAQLLVQKVKQYFAAQTPTEAEQVNISYIQIDTQEKAQSARARLDAGEDFTLVSSQVSTPTRTAASSAGRWFATGELPSFLEEAIASLSPGQHSQPISSTLGLMPSWYIVKVNERGMRPLSDEQLQTRQQQAYSDWLSEARKSDGVEILWKPEMAPPDPLLATQQAGGLPAGDTQQ